MFAENNILSGYNEIQKMKEKLKFLKNVLPFCGEQLVLENGDMWCNNINCPEFNSCFTNNVLKAISDGKKAQEALKKIYYMRENIEDYYGGVSINYSKMAHDMEDIAESTLKEQGIIE